MSGTTADPLTLDKELISIYNEASSDLNSDHPYNSTDPSLDPKEKSQISSTSGELGPVLQQEIDWANSVKVSPLNPQALAWDIGLLGGLQHSLSNVNQYPPGIESINGDYGELTGIRNDAEEADRILRDILGPSSSGISIVPNNANKLLDKDPNVITPFTFTVSRTGDTSQPLTVNWSAQGSGKNPAPIQDIGGTSGQSAVTGTVTFAAGQSTQNITIAAGASYTSDKPDEGFTVTVTAPDGSTASADGDIKGVPSPSLPTIADLASAAYDPASKDGYKLISTNGDVNYKTDGLNLNGFLGSAYERGNQIVVAFRGTFPTKSYNQAKNLAADTSWATGNPNDTLLNNIRQADTFLALIHRQHPDATITVTGHSLGGALAQLVGNASGYNTIAFNAPGTKLLAQNPEVQAQLTQSASIGADGTNGTSASKGGNANYLSYARGSNLSGRAANQRSSFHAS